MNVKQLIEMLQYYPGDMEVRVMQPTHNHWHQIIAAKIDTAEEFPVAHSAYLNADQVLDDERTEQIETEDGVEIYDGKEVFRVLVLS